MNNEEQLRRYLIRVTNELQRTRMQLTRAESEQPEPVAIIGMACRYPGGVRTPEDLWGIVSQGRDVVAHFPDDRGWDLDRLHHAGPGDPGASVQREGGFLYDAADFDAEFFAIEAAEAMAMDPQQRLLLETSWEALERAGLDLSEIRGSRTGVFTGLGHQDYRLAARFRDDAPGHLLTGTAPSVASGRIAYSFGFRGPSLTVDTACSSSLVTVHLACQSLRTGESTLALAGSAAVMSTPHTLIELSARGMLSADGRCRSFSADATGFGIAEGVGMVVLERLSDAQRNGHPVLAVICGSAVNSDGASNGLTAPSGAAQQQVIEQALAQSGVPAESIDLIEAHGTGTALGDRIEVQSLTKAYGADRPADRPLWLGSVKSNIGHTQAAAGLAGLIKTVSALREAIVPATLHADEPTPYVNWRNGIVRLAQEPHSWTRVVRTAGVSAFGFSGTNAHVILQSAPCDVASSSPGRSTSVVPVLLSARSTRALQDMASRLDSSLRDGADLHSFGGSLSARARLEHRAVVLAADRDEALDGLRAVADGKPSPSVIRGSASSGRGAVLLLPDMTDVACHTTALADAYRSAPEYLDCLRKCADELFAATGYRLDEVIAASGEVGDETVARMAHLCVVTGVAATFRAHGVDVEDIIGVGVGSATVAAHVSGELSFAQAVDQISTGTEGRDQRSAASAGIIADAIRSGSRGFVAFGAACALARSVRSVAAAENVDVDVIAADEGIHSVLARLHVLGVRVDWNHTFGPNDRLDRALPTYPFRSRRYWPDP